MKNSNFLFLVVIVLMTIGIIMAITKYTFSYEDNDNYVLFYTDDNEKLISNIKTYLNRIDDYLVANSSFLYSDILTLNYDFLTNYAMDYIINNKDLYLDKIKNMDEYHYHDMYFNDLVTDEYVPIDLIYEITDKYFGINYYNIINNDVNIINNYISLCDYTTYLFAANITDIKLLSSDDTIYATVVYDNLDKYRYSFKKKNNTLKIYDIEVINEEY